MKIGENLPEQQMQRPSSEAAEDRNQDWLGGLWAFAGQRPSSEAAEDRNYGRTVERRACPHGSGRLPRRPRIATPDCCGLGQRVIGAAAVFRGGRGSQPWLWNNIVVPAFRCSGRLPRRPRIATTLARPMRSFTGAAAAVFRGGRGSQRYGIHHHLHGIGRQRPSSEAAEDRNLMTHFEQAALTGGSGRLPRRPRIATLWHPPSPTRHRSAAAVFRGGRGSQLLVTTLSKGTDRRQRPSSEAAEDRNAGQAPWPSPSP